MPILTPMMGDSWSLLRSAYADAAAQRRAGDPDPLLLVRVLRDRGVSAVWTRPGAPRDLLESAFLTEVPAATLRWHAVRRFPGVARRRHGVRSHALLDPQSILGTDRHSRPVDAWWAIPSRLVPLSHVTAHARRRWRPGRTSTALQPLEVDLVEGGGRLVRRCLELPVCAEGWHNVLVWLRVVDDPDAVSRADDEDASTGESLVEVMVGDGVLGVSQVSSSLARVLAGLEAADVVPDGLVQVNLEPGTRRPYLGRLRCHLPD